jgi:hypothetical protein
MPDSVSAIDAGPIDVAGTSVNRHCVSGLAVPERRCGRYGAAAGEV